MSRSPSATLTANRRAEPLDEEHATDLFARPTLDWCRRNRHDQPVLRFTPYAWAKLKWFCHRGAPGNQTEIGGFGLSDADDPLLIIDLLTLRQQTTAVTVAFDDAAVADLLDEQVDQGVMPQRCMRVWLHTHPGCSAEPSGVDEETFARCFRGCDWSVMAILAEGGETYARLRFSAGPGGELLMPTAIDYTQPFAASDHAGWEAEYQKHVHPIPDQAFHVGSEELERFGGLGLHELDEREPWDLLDELQTAHTFEPLEDDASSLAEEEAP